METNLNAVNTHVNQNVRFEILSIDELNARPKMTWAVKNLLPARGLAVMYGKSGTGKTFLLIDLLLAIANGDTWFGHKTTKSPVCYVCLEGASGIRKRIAAWEKKTGKSVPNNFKIITNQLNLSSERDVHDLAICIKASGFSSGVIAIDTLNAASPKMDENSSRDMGNLIDHLKLLQRQTNSLALTTHHTGKDEKQGMRGHSSLHAAIDAVIFLKCTGPTRTWNLQKIRDSEPGESHTFKLITHSLGLDEEGGTITSCSIKSDSSVAAARPMPTAKNMALVFNQVANFIESEHTRTGKPVSVPYEIAQEHGAIALIHIEEFRRSNQAKKVLRKLVEQDFFESHVINGKELIGFR
jgi:hypothetical protein